MYMYLVHGKMQNSCMIVCCGCECLSTASDVYMYKSVTLDHVIGLDDIVLL